MADNIPITPGAGVDVATDDCGAAGHVQIMKLAVSADGSATPIPATSAGLTVVDGARFAATATLTNVNDAATSQSLLASNSARKGVLIVNDSTSILYLKYGATASATSYTVRMQPGAYWEMPAPIFTGALDGIWSADAAGAARITELS